MKQTYYISFFAILLGVAAVGYVWVSALIEKVTIPATVMVVETVPQTLQRRGTVEYLDPDKRFLILNSVTRYTLDGTSRYKIYTTEQTNIERSAIATENEVIYYENPPTSSNLSEIKIGDAVLVIISVADQKFTALYIRHGLPLPGI